MFTHLYETPLYVSRTISHHAFLLAVIVCSAAVNVTYRVNENLRDAVVSLSEAIHTVVILGTNVIVTAFMPIRETLPR